jgi:Mn-dependent DtxR family transcriptional regulator
VKAYRLDFKEMYKELINAGLVTKVKRQSKSLYVLTDEGHKKVIELLRR